MTENSLSISFDRPVYSETVLGFSMIGLMGYFPPKEHAEILRSAAMKKATVEIEKPEKKRGPKEK